MKPLFRATEREGGRTGKVSPSRSREETKKMRNEKKEAERALLGRDKAEGLEAPTW